MSLTVHQFPCLHDNYAFLLRDAVSGAVAVVDTPDVGAINAALAETGWRLTHILNTHHHFDHAGGNLELQAKHGCTIVGPRADAERIPGIEVLVGEGDVYMLGATKLEVFDVPGHTRGHIAYLARADRKGFVGDTLFALGCGRLFEGSPAQMWDSLQKITAWPDDCLIYCAHEYTQANAVFAVTVDPDNQVLKTRVEEIRALRAKRRPTVPTRLDLEKATNPFLRPFDPAIMDVLGMPDADPVAVFAEIRRRKDSF